MTPKLPVVSSREVIAALMKAGFIDAPKRGKGSHRAFCKDDGGRVRLVIVPERKEIPKGTILSILEQAGLTKDDIIELLK
ncbi:MAG: type II toxin-antitoxin system HicA family toxin [Nitrospirae bacterium]|nr:type II toxin-antitoxin system HicA family toxin [Nitrospirota bacterium]